MYICIFIYICMYIYIYIYIYIYVSDWGGAPWTASRGCSGCGPPSPPGARSLVRLWLPPPVLHANRVQFAKFQTVKAIYKTG